MWNTVQNSFVKSKNSISTIIRANITLMEHLLFGQCFKGKTMLFSLTEKLLPEAKKLTVVKELLGSIRGFCHFSYLDYIPCFSKPLCLSRTKKREKKELCMYLLLRSGNHIGTLTHTGSKTMLLCKTCISFIHTQGRMLYYTDKSRT